MGMNFQDQPSGEKPQKQPAPNFNDPRVDDIFVDSPSSGTKFLWIALIIVVLAGIGGGLYLLNKYGYLNFLRRKPAVSVVRERPPAPAMSNPAPAPPAATSSKAAPGTFAIQVSAFKAKMLADKYVTKLKRSGIDAFVFAEDVPNEGTWYKVCVGSYETKLRAIAATEEMKRKVGTDAWVVPVQ